MLTAIWAFIELWSSRYSNISHWSQITRTIIIIVNKFEISWELPNMTQRHEVSRYCWKNCACRLVGHKVAANLQQVKKRSVCKVQKETAAKWEVLCAASVPTSTCTPVSAPAGSSASVYITSLCLRLILHIHPVFTSTQSASGPTQIHTVWILLISC